MLRDTMIRTIPVAMMPIEALWTERFHRFRGLRNVPPDRMSNAIQITASAAIIPSIRVSTSSGRSTPATGPNAERSTPTKERISGAGWPAVVASPGTETPISLPPPSCAHIKDAPRPRVSEGGALSSRESRVNQPQAATLPAGTPWHRAALVIQPAERTSFKLACVIGFGVRRIELRLLLPGVVNLAVPVTVLGSES